MVTDMPEVSMDKFEGIREYHDGLAVSDYVNMIPLGDTCIDRLGDKLVRSNNMATRSEVRGVFVDSLNNIYIAVGSTLFISRQGLDGRPGPLYRMKTLRDGVQVEFSLSGTDKVTFCESSIKPTIVFCCDGTFIYQWNTTENPLPTHPERDPYLVNAMYLPGIEVPESGRSGTEPDMNKYVSGDSSAFDIVPDMQSFAKSICWFDNKLVMHKRGTTIVWISCTDPGQFYRSADQNPFYPTSGIPLWNSWYSSTNSSDTLVDIASYAGQLYFLNTHSIEVWGRTGNEDAPIQSNTTQVIHFGGRSPKIVEGNLYVIGRDTVGHEFVGMFSQQGFSRITNPEMEQRMGSPVGMELMAQRHENYLFVHSGKGNGFLFKSGRWSSWKSPNGESDPVLCSVIDNFAVTLYGNITEFDSLSRRTNDGTLIERYIREGFEQFKKRVIFRKVECVMDTGKRTDWQDPSVDPDGKDVYIALSTNRGLSFSQRHYRTLGKAGENNKSMVWRNLGSGNSVLLEIGSSSPHILQIYDLSIDIQ
jgi:hypothetical protein